MASGGCAIRLTRRFELTEDERGTVLVLDHSLTDETVGMAFLQRWTNSLDRLVAEVER